LMYRSRLWTIRKSRSQNTSKIALCRCLDLAQTSKIQAARGIRSHVFAEATLPQSQDPSVQLYEPDSENTAHSPRRAIYRRSPFYATHDSHVFKKSSENRAAGARKDRYMCLTTRAHSIDEKKRRRPRSSKPLDAPVDMQLHTCITSSPPPSTRHQPQGLYAVT